MKRSTIALGDDLFRLALLEAERRGLSFSALVRAALVDHLGLKPGRRRRLPFAAVGRSGHRNTARDFEDILAREWGGARRR